MAGVLQLGVNDFLPFFGCSSIIYSSWLNIFWHWKIYVSKEFVKLMVTF